MRSIIFAITLLCLVSLCSCVTKKVTTKHDIDLSKVSKIDSSYTERLSCDTGSYLDKIVFKFDSVITHITIIRYDTVVTDIGEPIIKERVEIEQVHIQKEGEETQYRDSTKTEKQIESNVAKNDSLHHEETYTKETKQYSKSFSWGVCVILFFVVVIAAGWKKKE